MKREHLNVLKSASNNATPKPALSSLERLGWQPFFAQQTSIDELAVSPPVRVVEVQRSGLRVRGDGLETVLPPNAEITVGDWLLLDENRPNAPILLQRKGLIKRRAAGHDRKIQLIAANIDTVFVVTSCNPDFNIARLERYIALALEAQVTPVIVLTKADMCDDAAPYRQQAESISETVDVVVLDARGEEPKSKLATWCKPGQTVAFLGSSGVGKSTLTNSLAENDSIETQAIREDDARGRHTTTSRQLYLLDNGCAVLDTPGMRELQLTDVEAGLADLFSDIEDLATQCRFNDCQHAQEPDCAVLTAIENGELDEKRFERWRKLAAEEQFNSSTLAERRSKDRAFGKMVRKAVQHKKR
ncbi:MAG: ribosome small subunit-dependent GTPase A [Rhizobiaceae bacterium]